jgi:tRNA modification GTPase
MHDRFILRLAIAYAGSTEQFHEVNQSDCDSVFNPANMSLPKNVDRNKTNSGIGVAREPVDCWCALLTGPGRSAVAVVAVRGDDAPQLISRCFTAVTRGLLHPGQVRYGRWVETQRVDALLDSQATAESVVIVPLSSSDYEIHCHGGVAASERIISDLRALGADCITSAQWTTDVDAPLLIREAEQALRPCLTAAMAAIAMDQIRGAMLQWCQAATETLQTAGGEQLATIRRQTNTILRSADLGLRLGDRYRVVLLGPPNVGKSSLINAIVGYDRSITMDLAGTTRDVLHADTVVRGVPIRVSDTAGLRDSEEAVEQEGVARARNAAQDADLIVLVGDPRTPFASPPVGKNTLRVHNKSDLLPVPLTNQSAICTVATTGAGVDRLIEAIADALVRWPESGTPVPVTERQVDLLEQIAAATESETARKLLAKLVHGG